MDAMQEEILFIDDLILKYKRKEIDDIDYCDQIRKYKENQFKSGIIVFLSHQKHEKILSKIYKKYDIDLFSSIEHDTMGEMILERKRDRRDIIIDSLLND